MSHEGNTTLDEQEKEFLAEQITDEFFKARGLSEELGKALDGQSQLQSAMALRVVWNLGKGRNTELYKLVEQAVDGIMNDYDVERAVYKK